MGKIEELIRKGEASGATSTNELVLLFDMAIGLMRGRDVESIKKSKKIFARIKEIDPDIPELYNDMGIIAFQEGGYDTSMEDYRKALRLGLERLQAYYTNAISLRKKAQYKDADNEDMKANVMNLNLGRIKYNMGLLLHKQKVHKNAEQMYRESITLYEDYLRDCNTAAISLEQKGRATEAEKEYQKTRDAKSQLAKVHYNLAFLLDEGKRVEEAIAEYKKTVTLNPKSIDAYNNMGNLFYKTNDYNAAKKNYEEAMKSDEGCASAHSNLGVLSMKKDNLLEAEKEYKKAIKSAYTSADAHYNLGILHHKLSRYALAEDAYRKCIGIDRRYTDAYYNLGILLQKQKRYKEAKEMYHTALKIDPGYANAKINLEAVESIETQERRIRLKKEADKREEIEKEEKSRGKRRVTL